jgi:hypothetical protein
MQWVEIEEEVAEEKKDQTGVDPAKFAASLKSDDAFSDTQSLKVTSRSSSDTLEKSSDGEDDEGSDSSETV